MHLNAYLWRLLDVIIDCSNEWNGSYHNEGRTEADEADSEARKIDFWAKVSKNVKNALGQMLIEFTNPRNW